jgi:hypothetical protein
LRMAAHGWLCRCCHANIPTKAECTAVQHRACTALSVPNRLHSWTASRRECQAWDSMRMDANACGDNRDSPVLAQSRRWSLCSAGLYLNSTARNDVQLDARPAPLQPPPRLLAAESSRGSSASSEQVEVGLGLAWLCRPIRSYPIRSDLLRSDLIRSHPISSDPSYLIRSYLIRSHPIRSYPIRSDCVQSAKSAKTDSQYPVVADRRC